MGPITIYAIFPGDDDAYRVRGRLTSRRYVTELDRLPSGDLVLIVTTDPVLRAEVEGLIWLGDGRIAQRREVKALMSSRLVG